MFQHSTGSIQPNAIKKQMPALSLDIFHWQMLDCDVYPDE